MIRLGRTGLFRARWTDRIHDEWITALLRKPSSGTLDQLERTRRLMNSAVLDCLVTGYDRLIDTLVLPDPGDRHVLAAAICGRASVIVTSNLKHFPESTLEDFGIEAQHPDVFVRHLIDLAPEIVCRVIEEQRASLKNPPLDRDSLLDNLSRCGLTKSVQALREVCHDL